MPETCVGCGATGILGYNRNKEPLCSRDFERATQRGETVSMFNAPH